LNSVVPTAVGSPLFLVVIPGQRAFLSQCGGRVVDLGGGGMGTICGHREVFEELRPQELAGSHQLATPDGGPGAAGYIEVQNRGDKFSIPGGLSETQLEEVK